MESRTISSILKQLKGQKAHLVNLSRVLFALIIMLGMVFPVSGVAHAATAGHITGRVLLLDGTPVAGVTVTPSVCLGTFVFGTTDAYGAYDASGATADGCTVTPSKTGYTFYPTNQTGVAGLAGADNIDFTATPVYAISGVVSQNGSGLAGVTVTASDGVTDYTFPATLSDGIFSILVPNGSYTVTPVLAGPPVQAFTPVSTTVAVAGAAVPNINFAENTFSISGHVYRGTSAVGLVGVSIAYGGSAPVTSTAGGAFTITGLPAGAYTLTPTLAGQTFNPATLVVTVTTANKTAQDLFMAVGSISGNVTDGSGGAVPGAVLTAVLSPWTGLTTTSAINGSYKIYNVPAGSFTVTASKTGYAFADVTSRVVVAGSDTGSVDFTAGLSTISGTILESGIGLVGVSVCATPGPPCATTNASGVYSIASVPNGTYTLTPTLTYYSFIPVTRSVTVAGASISANFSATHNTHSISGTVTSGGAGLAGVIVSDGATPAHTATTGAAGAYTISGVPDGAVVITPTKSGYGFAPASQSFVLVGANVSGVTFVGTAATYTISGTVLNSLGVSVVGVTVSDGTRSAVTAGVGGAYTITGVPAGSYTVTPNLSGYAFTPATRAVSITTAIKTGVNFTAVSSVLSISGTITAGGVGLEGVTVNATGGLSDVTDAAGNYSIVGVPSTGSIILTPDPASLPPATYTFTPVTRTVIMAGASVAGQDFTGVKTYSLVVTISGVTTAFVSVTDGTRTVTGTGPTYTIAGMPNGTYTITPSKPGYVFSPASRTVTVLDTTPTGVAFVSAATYSITGFVMSSGEAVAGVTVSDGTRTAVSAADGTYEIKNVPAGSYTLTPSKAGFTFAPTTLSATVTASNVTGKNFEATVVYYSISGVITPATSGVVVSDGTRSATSAADGTYVIANVPAGTYTVTPSYASPRVFTPAFRSVVVAANVSGVNFAIAPEVICYALTKVAGPSYGGTVSASPANSTGCASGQYFAGQVITMSYTQNLGYHFKSWSPNVVASKLTMAAAPATVTATYAANLRAGTYDDPNAAIAYSGAWVIQRSPAFYGGSQHITSSRVASATFYITGRQVGLIYSAARTYGKMKIQIDSTTVYINEYSAASLYRRQWLSGLLTTANHKVVITFYGPAGLGTIDGVLVR